MFPFPRAKQLNPKKGNYFLKCLRTNEAGQILKLYASKVAYLHLEKLGRIAKGVEDVGEA